MDLQGARWIWLSERLYPDAQRTFCTVFADRAGCPFALAEFQRTWRLDGPVRSARVFVSGDTRFRLWVDGEFVGAGPVAAGGDYGNALPMPKYYMNHYEIRPRGEQIHFFAQVQLSPEVMTDYSCGRGGFILCCEFEYADGVRRWLTTGADWQARLNPAYRSAIELDAAIPPGEWGEAAVVEDGPWNLAPSPIPMLSEQWIVPTAQPGEMCVPAGETREFRFEFDRVYSGYVGLDIEAGDLCRIEVGVFETDGRVHARERIATASRLHYRGLRMQSVGGYRLIVQNQGASPVRLARVGVVFTCYPVTEQGSFACSDPELNRIYEVGKWTLQICRQTLHLDSPLHQETLGCTGDYYVESLMEYLAFGDARLTRMDIVRTADWLRMSDGFMFHASYSLIWLQMMYDYYLFTGDATVFDEARDAMEALLTRFHGYLGVNGVLETPPNYMFVDWVMVDGYTLHHPPKALGQTCLNAFYYKALCIATQICTHLGDGGSAQRYAGRAAALKAAFNACFYDEDAGLYIDGLNTPGQVNEWQPENPDKRYYSRHANALAVLYGLCEGDDARRITRRAADGCGLTDAQPYFMHFILEAVDAAGLFGEWGMKLIDRWRDMVRACDKGLQEGWINPGNYHFDHSHAWGGTPTYQLPARLLGLVMLEPGFRRISLRPRLYGLQWADIMVPTPYGMLTCRLRPDRPPQVTHPEQVVVQVE